MATKVRTKPNNNNESNSIDQIIKDLYYEWNDSYSIKKNDSDEKVQEQRKVFFSIIRMIFEEVCNEQNVKIEDIEKIGTGAFATAFKVGTKVIKIGSRYTKTFPDNPYIIKPLLRQIFEVKDSIRAESIYVEVCEYVDAMGYKTVTKEDLYQLYSKMRDIGLEWLDIDPQNVGKLKKDNVIHWNESLEPTDEALELGPKKGEDIVLKEGDLVILDSDFIYEEGKIPEDLIHSDFSFIPTWKKFNQRYNDEKNGYKRIKVMSPVGTIDVLVPLDPDKMKAFMEEEHFVKELTGANLDVIIKTLIKFRENGLRAYFDFNGHILHSDDLTFDSAYMEVFGMDKKTHDQKVKDIDATIDEVEKLAKIREFLSYADKKDSKKQK